jgi:hypothetical protein
MTTFQLTIERTHELMDGALYYAQGIEDTMYPSYQSIYDWLITFIEAEEDCLRHEILYQDALMQNDNDLPF